MYRYLIIYILETNFNSSFKIRYYTIGLYLTLTSLINTNFTKKTQMFKKLSIVLLIAIISITTYAFLHFMWSGSITLHSFHFS